jgi:hypothetical protein
MNFLNEQIIFIFMGTINTMKKKINNDKNNNNKPNKKTKQTAEEKHLFFTVNYVIEQ